VARVLAASGARALTLVDDDVVDASNLHRQTLYTRADVGALKAQAAAARLHSDFGVRAEAVIDRFTPDNASALVAGHSLVVDGADNFASKFLIADAARLASVPVVHGGVVRLSGWALGTPVGGACLRCVFEDIPAGQPDTCSVAGVLGPVVGVIGALEALLAVDMARAGALAASDLYSFDARTGALRRRRIARRVDCALCTGQIRDLAVDRYLRSCAA